MIKRPSYSCGMSYFWTSQLDVCGEGKRRIPPSKRRFGEGEIGVEAREKESRMTLQEDSSE